MSMKKKLISSLKPLRPTLIVDAETGEILSNAEHNNQVSQLVKFVQSRVSEYYAKHGEALENDIMNNPPKLSPAEWARQHRHALDTSDLPRAVKAKSRIGRIFSHKLVSEVTSYVNNPNPRKQRPTFAPKINLGAVDSQMASISIDGNTLTMLFKAWKKIFLLEFIVPAYVLQRNIVKWSLPAVELRGGVPCYIFCIQEAVTPRQDNHQRAGVDFGRVQPFTLAVVNNRGRRVADYKSGGRLRELNAKRERIIAEKACIIRKANHYDALGLDSSTLREESKRKARKALILGDEVANRVGAEIAQKLEKHAVSVLAVENLTWVHGRKYGSKWVHSKMQAKTEHATTRIGIRTKKVNAKNTSQSCHRCGDTITHNAKKRTAHCHNCKEQFDRDFNAAMNIAKKTVINRYPARERRNGDAYSTMQGIENDSHSSQLRLVRMAT